MCMFFFKWLLTVGRHSILFAVFIDARNTATSLCLDVVVVYFDVGVFKIEH